MQRIAPYLLLALPLALGASSARAAATAVPLGATRVGAPDDPTGIVGGTLAAPHAWPDAVAVLAPTAACTGTLIAPDVVLTAGHCIETAPRLVVVDSVDYGAAGGEVIAVTSAIAYPDWQDHYDVGVLILAHPAKAPPRAIARGCQVTRGLVDGAAVHLVGFGLTTRSGKGDNSRLHEADVPVRDAQCAGGGCAPAINPGGEFVAGGHGADSCFGDSGGPVYLPTVHGPALIGVVSRGLKVGGLPCGGGGIYVRADQVVPWIEHVTGRKVGRARCDGATDDAQATDASAMAEPEVGGCAVGGGAAGGGLVVIAGLIAAATRRRRVAGGGVSAAR
jgi:secreted trypsin-like serine protease